MQQDCQTVDDILRCAIGQEQEAAEFYAEQAKRMGDSRTRAMFERFASDEVEHREHLEAVLADARHISPRSVGTLNVAAVVDDVEITPDMSLSDVYAFAMKREDEAYRMYLELAVACETDALTDMFLSLAEQEAAHRLRFETEYRRQTAAQLI